MANETVTSDPASAIVVDIPFAETIADLRDELGDNLLDVQTDLDELTITVRPDSISPVLRSLRDGRQRRYICLVDLCGVDYPERPERFEIVYHLLSPFQNARIRVKLCVGEETMVSSVISLFPNADWYEREVYDLFGVFFSGHPDLRRILTDYGFDGHPLRKDFRSPGSSRCAMTTI